MSDLVKVYVTLLESGRKNFNEVPSKLADVVKKKVESDGYIIDEDGWAYKA